MLRPSLVAICSVVFAGCPAGKNYYGRGDGLIELEDVAYTPDGHPRHKLDLYLPAKTETPFAFVIFVHGGFWRGQDRRYYRAITGLYGNVGRALARAGYGAALPSYRLHPAAGLTGEDQLRDIIAAIAWVRAHGAEHGGDPARIALMGHSAGGHLISVLALDRARLAPGTIRGAIALSGIYDVREAADYPEPDVARAARELWGPDFARYSPLDLARADAPPMLFVAGSEDYPMCLSQHRAMQARLPAATFVELAGVTHEDMVLEIGSGEDSVTPEVLRFLERAMK